MAVGAQTIAPIIPSSCSHKPFVTLLMRKRTTSLLDVQVQFCNHTLLRCIAETAHAAFESSQPAPALLTCSMRHCPPLVSNEAHHAHTRVGMARIGGSCTNLEAESTSAMTSC